MTSTGASPELTQRLLSAIVLAVLALGAVIVSPWSFLVLVLIGGVLLASEWGGLTRGKMFDGITVIHAVAVVATGILVTVDRGHAVPLVIAIAALAIVLMDRRVKPAVWALFGLAYLALAVWAFMRLRCDAHFGLAAVLFLLAVAWTTDTMSYFAGRRFGGPKLAPRLSPKKTWSGFLIGTLSPAIVGVLFAYFLGETSPFWLALIGVALALACQMGDLLESGIKRHFGAKDMGQLIPGHGGLFDRVDSVLLASIVAAVISFRNPAAPGAGLLIW